MSVLNANSFFLYSIFNHHRNQIWNPFVILAVLRHVQMNLEISYFTQSKPPSVTLKVGSRNIVFWACKIMKDSFRGATFFTPQHLFDICIPSTPTRLDDPWTVATIFITFPKYVTDCVHRPII